MIILRALLDIVVFIILIPIKVIALIAVCTYCVYASLKFGERLSEWLGIAFTGIGQVLKKEIRWIKTGEI